MLAGDKLPGLLQGLSISDEGKRLITLTNGVNLMKQFVFIVIMLCHYAECPILFIIMLNAIMVSVVMPSVVAPSLNEFCKEVSYILTKIWSKFTHSFLMLGCLNDFLRITRNGLAYQRRM
jgi:hypothetical protein